MKKEFNLVFCQSLGDIKYTISLCHQYNNAIVVITLPAVYNFIKHYNYLQSVKVIYLLYPSKNIDFIKFPFIFRRTVLELKNYSFETGNIFSLGFDWISLAILNTLRNNIKKINYWDYYKNIPEKIENTSISSMLRSSYYFMMTGTWFKYYFKINSRITIVYKEKVKEKILYRNVSEIEMTEIKLLKPNVPSYRTIVFIDSIIEGIDIKLMEEVITELIHLGHSICIKNHPNLKNNFLLLSRFNALENVPIEFIDLSSFTCVIGLGSAAIIKNNCPLKISILDILKNKKNADEINRFKNHLKNLDKNNEVVFPSDIDELIQIINR